MRRALYVLLILSIVLVSCTVSTNTSAVSEESEVRSVVEDFGRRIQAVPLQSPHVLEEMRERYTELVSPELLQKWVGDISQAPGRIVSSPWPDRIEITSVVEETSDKYLVTGYVAEVTSVEVVSGGAANKIPVRITVEKAEGRWMITEYTQQ